MLTDVIKLSYNKDLFSLFGSLFFIRELLLADNIVYYSAVLKFYSLLFF